MITVFQYLSSLSVSAFTDNFHPDKLIHCNIFLRIILRRMQYQVVKVSTRWTRVRELESTWVQESGRVPEQCFSSSKAPGGVLWIRSDLDSGKKIRVFNFSEGRGVFMGKVGLGLWEEKLEFSVFRGGVCGD